MKFLKGLALTLLVLILFVCTAGILVLYPIRSVFEKENIRNTISNFEIEEMVEESPEFKEAVDQLFDPVFEQTRELGIKDEVVLKIIDSQEVKGFVGDIAGNVVDYYLTGDNQKLINVDNITSLVGQVMDDIDESGFYEFKQEEKDQILQVVKEQATEYEDLIPDTEILDESLDSENKEILETVRFFMGSDLSMYLIIGIVISLVGIVALKWKGLRWIKYSAITWIVNGSLAFLLMLVLSTLLHSANIDSYVLIMVDRIFNLGYTLSIGLLVVAIIMLVAYGVIAHIRKPKEQVPVTE